MIEKQQQPAAVGYAGLEPEPAAPIGEGPCFDAYLDDDAKFYPELGNASVWCCTELTSRTMIDTAAGLIAESERSVTSAKEEAVADTEFVMPSVKDFTPIGMIGTSPFVPMDGARRAGSDTGRHCWAPFASPQ